MRLSLSFLKLLYLLPVFLLVWPSAAFSIGGETPISQGLRYVIDAMYGSTGAAAATVAVMIGGITCMFGWFDWKLFGKILVGCAIVIGAGAIVRELFSLVSR